jgi:ankyrin repeat protein
MSPAKVTGPRKWRDKNGRTFLSRAASNNDLAAVRIKYNERPEDLNLPDNAGNTPLQIAALQGYVDIVRFLLENGCEVDTRNIDRDTALIDAVENGHVEVVKLLLIHGANPRLGNAKGDEPYELVPPDDENYDEIRALLADAKDRPDSHRVSIDYAEAPRDGASSRAASAASPRDSPPMMGPRSPPAGFGRRRTGRSESTRNDLLWQANTQENLKKLAAQGDVQGVANILNVLQKAETESLIAAAKAGHEEVLQYLLAMGDTEPDPDPIRHLKVGYNTPLLAAIGRGHPEVVKLLVEQSGFNPMRKLLKGKSYYEISAERRGEQWQKEYEILKTAYDKYAVKQRKANSPRATRDGDKFKARTSRRSQSPTSNNLRKSSSPSLTHKQLQGKSPNSSERDRDRDTITAGSLEKRRHQAAKRDIADLSVAVSSDQDQTIHASRKGHLKRRSQSDYSQQSNPDHETSLQQRRRRLVTGKEHRRRTSNVGGSSDSDTIVAEPRRPTTVLKRTRDSVSPPGQPVTGAGENGRSTAKKRRTVIESSPEETRPRPRKGSIISSSPVSERKVLDENASNGERSTSDKVVQEMTAEAMEVDKPGAGTTTQTQATGTPTSATLGSGIPLQQSGPSEEIKPNLIDPGPSEAELQAQREEEERKTEDAKRAEEERIAAEKAAEEQRLAEEAARLKKAEEEAALRKMEEEERQMLRKKKEEEERQELRRRREEEERQELRRKEEEERQERRRKEEEERQELRRRREEEERQERVRRELEERQRRHEEQLKEQQRRLEEQLREQQRRERLEAEERRRDALPALLKQSAILLDRNDPEARSPAWLKLFLPLYTAKSVQLDPNTPDAYKNELWVPNFQVAGLLATKDLNLRNYTSLETRPVTMHERQRLWSVARNSLSYDVQTSHWNTTIKQAIQREEEQRPKFYAMEELFWVKVCSCRQRH